MNDNININPNYWGNCVWKFINSFISIYPENPNEDVVINATNFFHSLVHLLPCDGCRNSYNIMIHEPDTNINDITNFTSRNAIINLVYNIRNKVNNKLDRYYYITKNYFKKKLDAMICVKNNKLSGYANIMCEVPYVHEKLENKVYDYLRYKTKYNPIKTNVIIKKTKEFIYNPIFNVNNKNFLFFFYRCIKCRSIHSKLFNLIHVDKLTIDESFVKYKTLYDRLLFWGCTFLTSQELQKYIDL